MNIIKYIQENWPSMLGGLIGVMIGYCLALIISKLIFGG